MRRHEFRAMGTDVVVLGPDVPAFAAAARAVVRRFEVEEERCSRFRPDSELSRVNAAAGAWVDLSPGLAEHVRAALRGARRSGGAFDPTILPAIVAAGYDRDFDDLVAGARDVLNPPAPGPGWSCVELDGARMRMPAGVGLDLGGIAKGRTSDLAAEEAAGSLGWALVSAGGDLRVAGHAPPIPVAVEDPAPAGGELLRLRLEDGGLATSSVLRRRWGPGLHHVIDPRTGRPADTGVVQATVWAPTCEEAEVAAKRALLVGRSVLEETSGVLVLDTGSVLVSFPATGWVSAA